MPKYILRLDDASDYMDTEKWEHVSILLDELTIKPIFGIIPQNRDEALTSRYDQNPHFWEWVYQRLAKGWVPAMHGYEHRYVSKDGGIHPVNNSSEFAGLPYEEQCRKIATGYAVLKAHGIETEIFFAPAHTFDENTLRAIKNTTPIRVISDTVAYDTYKWGDFWFIPQQSGKVRRLPVPVVTFCYHPNRMDNVDFENLKKFCKKFRSSFITYKHIKKTNRSLNIVDSILKKMYFSLKNRYVS